MTDDLRLAKKIADMIHDHTMLNMEWGPLGYDRIALAVIAEVRRAEQAVDHRSATALSRHLRIAADVIEQQAAEIDRRDKAAPDIDIPGEGAT